jgi:hypothetical protein
VLWRRERASGQFARSGSVGSVAVAVLAALGSSFVTANAWAQDAASDGSEFVDMPDSYYEQKRLELATQPAPPDERETPGYIPGYLRAPSVSLSPHAPQVIGGIPGTLAPSFGAPTPKHGFRFDFRGYLQAAIRTSVGKRETAVAGQRTTTLHGDPIVPGGSYGWFDHTMTVPGPWSQLNFIYGNDVVSATVIIGAWSVRQADEASGYLQPNAQTWFNDAFLTYTPNVGAVGLKVNVGVFSDRYGAMAKWHNGAYGAPLIAEIQGVGTTATVSLPFEGDITLIAEGGVKGDMNKAPRGILPDGSNEYARPEEGSTFVGHGHLGFKIKETFAPTVHFVRAFSQDDRADLPNGDPNLTDVDESIRGTGPGALRTRDGSVTVIGADVRMDMDRFGYLYLGGSRVTGEWARSVSNIVQVLNSGSGKEFNERYWGYASGGNGDLTFLGGQYTLSLGTLLRHPMEYWGEGPDLNVTLFGIYGSVGSEAKAFDGRNMLKYGTELVYSMTKHLATSVRADHVMPYLDDSSRNFAVISPKIILRSDWVTRESLTIQYAGYLLNDNVEVKGDNRLVNIASGNPDKHLVAIYGTMWW